MKRFTIALVDRENETVKFLDRDYDELYDLVLKYTNHIDLAMLEMVEEGHIVSDDEQYTIEIINDTAL